jgi:hypothetical protein
LGRPDVPVFPLVAEVRLGLHRPCPGAADNRQGAESWWDADRDAARLVCPDKAGAIPEVHRGPMAVDAEKLAGHARVPADAARAYSALQARRASADVPAARLMPPVPAEAAPCIRAWVQSAA